MSSSSQSGSVSMLPNEVLGHILELGFLNEESRGNSPWNFSFSGCYNFQLSVSRVSRQFRNVAIHTRHLWSIIHVEGISLESDVAYVKTCLERSGSLLCTIYLNYDEFHFTYPNPGICEIMALVSSNMYRLERFFVKSPQIPILHQMMGYLNKPAPRLTTLEFSYTPFPLSENLPTGDDFQFLLFGNQMPMLTTILLGGASAFRWPGYNLENITELGLSFVGVSVYQELRILIQRTPLLRKLGLRGSTFMSWTRQTEADSAIELNFLEYLEIAFFERTDAIDVVSFIRAPILKSLTLAHMRRVDYSTLLDAISRRPLHFPSVVSLLLEDLEASNEAFTKLLHVYPNLEWLGIYDSIRSTRKEEQKFLHVLGSTKSIGGLRLCPKLKTLCCYGFSLKHIQDVLAKRAEANIPLPKIELSRNMTRESPHYNPSALLWLRQNTQVEFVPIVLDDY